MQVINKLILGTVQFGLDYGINNTIGKPSEEDVYQILSAAYASGIRILDTAEAYGDSHQLIGKFHRRSQQSVFDVVTKLPNNWEGRISDKVVEYLDQLNIQKLKGLLFHSYKSYKTSNSLLIELKRLKAIGLINYLGVSVYTNAEMEDVISDSSIDIIQLPFNLFDNINHRGNVLAKAKKKGKIIHTRSAFLQGLFFKSLDSENKVVRALKTELKYITSLSSHSGRSIESIALNYCLQQPHIDNVLIGVDNIQQLHKNISYVSNSLPENLVQKIDALYVENSDLLNPSLWME